jgi:hypothetical protein
MDIERVKGPETPPSPKGKDIPTHTNFKKLLKVEKPEEVDPEEKKKKRQRAEETEETATQKMPETTPHPTSLFQLATDTETKKDIFGRSERTCASCLGQPERSSIPSVAPETREPGPIPKSPQILMTAQFSETILPSAVPYTEKHPDDTPLTPQQNTSQPNQPQLKPTKQPVQRTVKQPEQPTQPHAQSTMSDTAFSALSKHEPPNKSSKNTKSDQKSEHVFSKDRPSKNSSSEIEDALSTESDKTKKNQSQDSVAFLKETTDKKSPDKSSTPRSSFPRPEEKKEHKTLQGQQWSVDPVKLSVEQKKNIIQKYGSLENFAHAFASIIPKKDTKKAKDSDDASSAISADISLAHPVSAEVAQLATAATTPVNAYIHPEAQNLFAQMVGTIIIMTTQGITQTEVILNSPLFENSRFFGSTILLEQYSTAPNSFNIRLMGNPAQVTAFNNNLEGLWNAFEKGNFAFSIGRLDASYEQNRPLFRRKSSVKDQGSDLGGNNPRK